MPRKSQRRAIGSDYDGTATTKKDDTYRAAIQVVNQFALGPDAHQARAALRDLYFRRAVDGTLSDAEGIRWICQEADIFVQFGLEQDAMLAALEPVALRPGAVEAFRMANELDVPLGFISFGIADFIEPVLGRLGIRSEVMALRLRWKSGKVVGWYPETVVHPKMKGFWARSFARRHRIPYDLLFGLGDSRGDRTLGLLENRLGIARDEHDRAFLDGFFSEVVITEDYDPVRAWLRRRTGLPF